MAKLLFYSCDHFTEDLSNYSFPNLLIMKKIKLFTMLTALLLSIPSVKAQLKSAPPDGVIFQAVATDAQGNPAAGRTIYVLDQILQKTATGAVVYSETFQEASQSTVGLTSIKIPIK